MPLKTKSNVLMVYAENVRSNITTMATGVEFVRRALSPHGVLTSCSRRIKARLLYVRYFFCFSGSFANLVYDVYNRTYVRP